jgi:hypothetical protein
MLTSPDWPARLELSPWSAAPMLAMRSRFVNAKTDMKANSARASTWRPIGSVSVHADTRALLKHAGA